MKRTAAFLLFALLSMAGLAMAQGAVVEAVQYPAWLERGGAAVPLTPGTTLGPKDQLRTGKNARVQLKMPEGSTVKLGENARFSIDKTDDRGFFRATLSVIAGAFRFTTDALRKNQRRDVTIKVKHVTAGIRGTDLWGKSTDERDLVCLLEGKISVGSEGHPTVTLDQPLDFYQRPRDGTPSVAKVDEKQIAQWAAETELSPDGPGARVGGDWRVTAAAFPTRDEALAMN
ncbi:MAG: FecR domain-containing protein, partial [Burkholderiales bacterium]|nr:FecR domain-containing protein [Burkholderiales bacterium]